ncbi:MAG: hypothetical protein HZA93_14620 [Verrucomicrobia bacterium]|nr:hypothetical protein [Verrucomicrobiota bacterium]
MTTKVTLLRTIVALILMSSSTALGAGRLVNISSRAVAGAGADALTAGFVITGTAPKRILLRGAGPALAGVGVVGALAEVRLELFRGTVALGVNSRWDAGTDASAIVQAAGAVGAFAFATGSNDAALLVTLAPGNYSATVSPARTEVAAGVALVEVYDADPASDSQLVNLSTRARAGTGPSTLIAGFVVAGDGGNRLLVRAAGPMLATGYFGVAGALVDPRLEVFQNGTGIAYNDDWEGNANPYQISAVARNSGAFFFGSGMKDSALLLPRAAGAYTAQVVEAPEAGGVALIEVYDTAAYRAPLPSRAFDLVGFARVSGHGTPTLTGGGTPTMPYNPATRTGNFWIVDDAVLATTTPAQLQAAFSSDQPLVVEINTMIDLSRFGRPNNGSTAIAHPDLFTAGRTSGTVGILAIGSNKTLYSAYGNGGFRRGSLTVDGKSNIALRNLKFRELWEWDDATAGAYDRNGWDYIALQSSSSGATVTSRAHHLWIDHCDFEKAYDGTVDIVHGTDLVTVSWCKIGGAISGESVRWLRRQLDYLEANRASFPYYNSLRATRSMAEIFAKESFQQKSNLVGNGTDANTRAHDLGYLNVTFHHNWYLNVDQRMPRLRFGNAHVFNLIAESGAGRGVFGLVLSGVAATSGAAVRVEDSHFEGLRLAVNNQIGIEPLGFITVLRSNNWESFPASSSPVDLGFDRAVSPESFAWNTPAASSGIGSWPVTDSAVMPAGYVPAGTTLADYRDGGRNVIDSANREFIGVIVPADEAEAALLRVRWQAPTAPR